MSPEERELKELDNWFNWLKARMPEVKRLWIEQALIGFADFKTKELKEDLKRQVKKAYQDGYNDCAGDIRESVLNGDI